MRVLVGVFVALIVISVIAYALSAFQVAIFTGRDVTGWNLLGCDRFTGIPRDLCLRVNAPVGLVAKLALVAGLLRLALAVLK
jgi:hypothetical protein